MTRNTGRRKSRSRTRPKEDGPWSGEARLFLAVPVLPEAAAEIAAALERRFPRGLPGRAVKAEGWHLTLRFLGATTPEAGAKVVEGMRAAALGAPFDVSFGGVSAFPDADLASVLWLGVRDGADAVRRLAAIAEQAAVDAGFPAEERPFSPHLTLARLHPPEPVRYVVRGDLVVEGRMPVTEVVLYRSHLRGGARYEAVERFPLAAGGDEPEEG